MAHQERGAEKERREAEELLQKQLEEERARIPRAHPYPYTTDYPVVCMHTSSVLYYLSSVDRTATTDIFTPVILSVAGSTKTRTEAMHETRTFPIGKFVEA